MMFLCFGVKFRHTREESYEINSEELLFGNHGIIYVLFPKFTRL